MEVTKQYRGLNKVAGILFAAVVMLGGKVQGADPDLLTDFDPPNPISVGKVDGKFFTFTGFRGVGSSSNATTPGGLNISLATVTEFPALSGLGVAYVSFEMRPSSVVPLHYHPRGSELHLVLQGSVTVGFVDTANKLFIQTLQAGDMFVFPKGMLHFQINEDTHKPALAMSALSSSNPGIVMLPPTLFASGIDDLVLQNSFKISPQSLAELKAPFSKNV